MAFPQSDCQYSLITDAATGTAEFTGGLGAILTQIEEHGNHYAISFASQQLKDHEKNYFPFLFYIYILSNIMVIYRCMSTLE
jgi:hypothetical protein